jgi:hypothetical protein
MSPSAGSAVRGGKFRRHFLTFQIGIRTFTEKMVGGGGGEAQGIADQNNLFF